METLPLPLETQVANVRTRSMGQKINLAFYITLAYLVFSNPMAYRVSEGALSMLSGGAQGMMSETGVPSAKGILLHAVAFMVVALYFMR